MRIAIGCDHWGVELKQTIMELLKASGHSYEDLGCYTTDAADYPDFAKKVAEGVAGGGFERGILICNNGIGMSIAANKVKGIRAAICYTAFNARRTRQHQNANILCLGAGKEQKQEPIAEIVNAFLTSQFEGGRHQRRLDKIRAMENQQ
ncbi:MAG TPA: ribose 5-phosphate isomerase B [Dehalococcoidia bacterium]|nr:ribose 5-phosphate isomerase B [Dehalococcoidia bacterium]